MHRPSPRLLKTPEDAEQAACDWMRYWGFADAYVAGGGGPDGGVDVDSSAAVAQVKALIAGIPSRHVVLELRRLRHRNPSTRFDVNDLNDLSYLSVVVPYCDIVVTEKQWRHLIRRTRLDSEYETIVLSDLADLTAYIV